MRTGRIAVVGAGIAGLTVAIALAARGRAVEMFERAPELAEVGAGIQLSPNATRILDRLGVLSRLRPHTARPEQVVLSRAGDLSALATVPLGAFAEQRWGAPYLTTHRADLQAALASRAAELPGIKLHTGTAAQSVDTQRDVVRVGMRTGDLSIYKKADLAIGADGVRSMVRAHIAPAAAARGTRHLAWRTTLAADDARLAPLALRPQAVCAFLSGRFHLVAYPVRGGAEVNLAAFTRAAGVADTQGVDRALLARAMARAAPALARLAEAADWTLWPVETVPALPRWHNGERMVLIGDAAHAMPPFAAQGAAMAIEDAETLAAAVAPSLDFAAALRGWEAARRPRIDKVRRRGALNAMAWHARGPVTVARDLALRLRSPEKLAADLDWLYGWQPPGPPFSAGSG